MMCQPSAQRAAARRLRSALAQRGDKARSASAYDTHRLVFTALVWIHVAEYRPANEQREAVGFAEHNVHQEEHKVLLVVPTDAVVHPRAVVVHALHTEVARRTVVYPFQLVVEALAADRHHAALPTLDDALRRQFLRRNHVARHHARAGGHAGNVRCCREEGDAGECSKENPPGLQRGVASACAAKSSPARTGERRWRAAAGNASWQQRAGNVDVQSGGSPSST